MKEDAELFNKRAFRYDYVDHLRGTPKYPNYNEEGSMLPLYPMGNIKEEREIGREMWKGLGKPGQGFPQGANFSPFLACLVVGKALKQLPGLIMYMDDGLIYANTKAELAQRIRRLKERLSTVQVELQESKSGMVKEGNWFKGIKFLGIRIHPNLTAFSETRGGTIKEAKLEPIDQDSFEYMADYYNNNEGNYEDLIKEFLENYQRDGTSSEKRVQDWLLKKSSSKLKGLKWAAEKGFLSNIIAEIHNPSTEPDRAKAISEALDKQLDGELNKISECFKPKSFSGHIIDILMRKQPGLIPDINTISTHGSRVLLKVIKNRRSRRGGRKLARR